MVALYILGGIILFFVFILMLRAEVVITYASEFALSVRILGIPIQLVPSKKKKVKLSDYSPRKRAKYEEKQRRLAAEKAKKKAEKKAKKEAEKAKRKADRASGKRKNKKPLSEIIEMIADLIKIAFSRFGKHFRIRIARLHIAVGSEDAAKTAILYGTISQAVCYLAAILDSTNTLRNPQKSDIDIHADYLSEKMTVDIEIGFSMKVWQLFDILLRTGFGLIKHL